jgi:hypothetical protein
MHFHLPKPLHGWRAFAGEVGVIVLGVLIALAAQQVVQDIRDRHDVEQLRGALRSELADMRARWENMRTGDHCAVQRLDALDRWLATAPPGARVEHAYPIFLWNMHSSAWDIAKTSPAAAQIPLRERLTYGSLYAGIDNWRELLSEERINSEALSALFATADQPENRRQIAVRIAAARIELHRRQLNYPYFFARFDELGIRPDASQLTVASDPRRLCDPLGS